MGDTDADPTLGHSQGPVADLRAAGEAINEMEGPMNDEPKNKSRKCVYSVPAFMTKKATGHEMKASYPIVSKLKAVEFSKMFCPDGMTVGNTGAAEVLGVDNKHIIIELSKQKAELDKEAKKSERAGQICKMHPGRKASTAEVEEKLSEYINIQRKQHLGVGRREVLSKIMELKPDALGGLPKGDNVEEVEKFDRRVNKRYSGFRKRPNFSIRRLSSIGQKLPKGFEGKAWATPMKARTANVKGAAAIHAKRTAATAREGCQGPAAALLLMVPGFLPSS